MNELISNAAAAFLNLRRLPARCDVRQTAAILGLNEDHVPILVKAGLLTPLGEPMPNSPKYFFARGLVESAGDEKWMGKAQKYISRHFRAKKQDKRQRAAVEATVSQIREAA